MSKNNRLTDPKLLCNNHAKIDAISDKCIISHLSWDALTHFGFPSFLQALPLLRSRPYSALFIASKRLYLCLKPLLTSWLSQTEESILPTKSPVNFRAGTKNLTDIALPNPNRKIKTLRKT